MPLHRRNRDRGSGSGKRGRNRPAIRRETLELISSIMNMIAAIVLLAHAVWTVAYHL